MAFIPSYQVRNFLLIQTDWTQVSDNALTQEEKDAWKVYRQALRDLDVSRKVSEWPVPPGQIECTPSPPEWLMEEPIYKYLV
jgi:hypothetical protein